jgi:hypothetical protein
MAEIAFPEADGDLGPKYKYASLIHIDRVIQAEKEGLTQTRRKAEGLDRQEREELEAKRKSRQEAADQQRNRKLERIDSFPVFTKQTCNLIGQIASNIRHHEEADELLETYEGSDGAATRRLYRRLEQCNDAGPLAAYLLRAQKASSRAKRYRGKSKSRGYNTKGEAIGDLCRLLKNQDTLRWGWGYDEGMSIAPHVLYVDLPNGQVSFHAPERGEGPEYADEWDGQFASEQRILDFAIAALALGPGEEMKGRVTAIKDQTLQTNEELQANNPALARLQRE